MTETKLKTEADFFFKDKVKEDKKTFKKKISDLIKREKNTKLKCQSEIQKLKKGQGKHAHKAPNDFCPEIIDNKEQNVHKTVQGRNKKLSAVQ